MCTTEVFFDGPAEADGDHVAALGEFGGGAESVGRESWDDRPRDRGRHFWVALWSWAVQFRSGVLTFKAQRV